MAHRARKNGIQRAPAQPQAEPSPAYHSSIGEFTATWYDLFPGGCVTSRLRLTTDPNGESAGQAPHVLEFTTRAALGGALSQRSGGRLELDPEKAR